MIHLITRTSQSHCLPFNCASQKSEKVCEKNKPIPSRQKTHSSHSTNFPLIGIAQPETHRKTIHVFCFSFLFSSSRINFAFNHRQFRFFILIGNLNLTFVGLADWLTVWLVAPASRRFYRHRKLIIIKAIPVY